MTPKEKAAELVDKFRMNVLDYEGCSINTHKAKQCALIAVDEIIQEFGTYYIINTGGKNEIYWEQVKQEIEKL